MKRAKDIQDTDRYPVTNPAGWGTAVVLAAGSAAVGYASGRFSRTAYTLSERKVDFVSGLGVDALCQ